MLQKQYQAQSQRAVASYNYTDIAEGTGVVAFQGFNSSSSGASVKYHLADVSIASNDIVIDKTGTGTSTENFDTTPFNLPKNVIGTAIIRFCAANTNSNSTSYFGLTLQKVSGAEVTNISSQIWTESLINAVTKNYLLRLPLTQTHFKKGDFLRLAFFIVFGVEAGGHLYVAHDPMNRASTGFTTATYPTKFELFIPFKIDL